jgi:hypothetical protein
MSLAALSLSLLLACAHRVQIQSDPPGARVEFRGQDLGPAPVEIRTWWWPGRRLEVRLTAPGRRPAHLDLSRDMRPLRLTLSWLWPPSWGELVGRRVRARHSVLMVRTHGRAGTWTPDDAQRP